MFTIAAFLGRALPALFILGTLYFLLLSASNVLWLRLSSRPPRIRRGRMVSVLIPARDEEENIGACIDSLLTQSYTNYEIVALDDQSHDGTWNIIEGFARRFPTACGESGESLFRRADGAGRRMPCSSLPATRAAST